VSDTTTVRTTIRDAIATALGLDFVDGKIDGPLRDLSIGCTWPDSQSVAEGDANFVEFRFVARVIIATDTRVTETDPQDPGDLETIAQSIAMTVGTVAGRRSRIPTSPFTGPSTTSTRTPSTS
jgi:hypothetical protein